MNLDEMLIYADIEHIHKIVENYKCQCNRHSKTEMIQTIIYTFFHKDTLDAHLAKIDAIEYTFIQLLYLDARNKYSMEDLIAKGKQALAFHDTTKKPRELVLSALKSGWIFQGVGKRNAFSYLIPQDVKKNILRIMGSRLNINLLSSDQNFVYRDERSLLVSDLASFLSYVSNESVILTGKGNIYKRQQKIILDAMLISEEPLGKVTWRFGYGRRYNEYPDRFSIIYDYAFYHKLIHEEESGYLYLTKSGEAWLNQRNLMDEEKKLYTFWIRLYKRPIPFLQLIVKLIDLSATNQWVLLNSIENEVLFWLKDHYYETKEMVFHERIIKMLLHLGVLQLGYQKEQAFIRVTEEGHHWVNGSANFDVKEIIMKKNKK